MQNIKQFKELSARITKRVDEIRVKRGLQWMEISKGAGVKWSTLNSITRGVNGWGLDPLIRVAKFLKVTTDYLAFENENANLEELLRANFQLRNIIKEKDREIVLLQNFITDYLEGKTKTSGKAQSSLAKRINKSKSRED